MDDLYRFIHAWVPNLYGELDENYWLERGYILSDTDTDLSPELSPHESGEGGDSTEESKARDGQGDDITELTRESWEVSTLRIWDVAIRNIDGIERRKFIIERFAHSFRSFLDNTR